jgi:hypothetical protein
VKTSSSWFVFLSLVVVPFVVSGCAAEVSEDVSAIRSNLTGSERRERAGEIRDAAAGRGLTNGVLLAGIAEAETNLAHCWSEATWACQGPTSPDCGGGPVIAGAADGPCSAMQGGLGMFQFDAGTFSDTLAREGDRILTVAGNTQAAVDFVVAMVIRSTYVEGVETEAQAIDWMNEVRPWNALWTPWIQTVTHYYNGCVPGRCSVYDARFAHYTESGERMFDEMGADFWYGLPPACGPLGAMGGVLDDADACFGAGGPPRFWRTEEGPGFDGQLLWTNATDAEEPDNWAFWSLLFEEPGAYLVEIYTDTSIARSQQTAYAIEHAGERDVVVVDQTARDGFRELGVFTFAGEGSERIRVDDNTGEPLAEPRAIVADAVRLTRVSEMPPPPPPPPPAGRPTVDRVTVTPLGGGGCAVAPARPASEGSLLFGLGIFAFVFARLWIAATRRR